MVASRIVFFVLFCFFVFIACVSFVVRKVDAAERTLNRG